MNGHGNTGNRPSAGKTHERNNRFRWVRRDGQAGRTVSEHGDGRIRHVPCPVAVTGLLVIFLLLSAGCTQTGSLLVSSDPAGASVSVNGAEKGVTPLELGDLAAGYYLVAVQSAGYLDTQRNISVTPGSRETVQFTLIPLPAIPGKKYSTVTDTNTGAVRNILYAGGWRVDAGGPSVSRVVVTVGKDAADDPDRFPLDGADVMITGKKDIVVLKQNTPLYTQGRYPGAGTWGIENKLNSDDDNTVDRNEQFTLVLVPGPGQAIPFNEPLTVEIRPRIGASAVFVPPEGAPSQAVQPAVAATQPVTTPAAAPGSSGSPTVPYAITAGGNTPEGAVYTYFNAMDRGDAATGLGVLLQYVLMPEDQKAALLQNATSASARTFGRNGEYLTLGNMMVTKKEEIPVCTTGDPAQIALCRSNVTAAYQMTITMDETLSGQSKSSRSYNMAAFLYRGSWKLIA